MVVDHAACQSLTAMFFAQADSLGNKPFLWSKRGGTWQSLSWRQTADAVQALAGGLRALGLAPGDRVMLVSENRPEWVIADLAVMSAGGISVPAYVTNTPADHLHILNNSGARFAIVSTRPLAEKLLAACLRANLPPTVIAIDPPRLAQSPGAPLVSWDEALASGRGFAAEVRDTVATVRRGDTACIMHTSGTGGAPKGVTLSHGALLTNCQGAYRLLEKLDIGDEVFLSFLPLSHSYEHTAGLYLPISIGAQIYYAEGLDQLAANMAEARPTIMTAVPRLYETMRARILRSLHRQGGIKAKLFLEAVELGTRRIEKGRLPVAAALANRALDTLVRRKVRDRFGGRLKALVSGGAPLAYDVGLFFSALGIRILQGYGQTEAGPVISCNPPGKVKLDTVGPPLAGVELKIAEDGEILVRGELVMTGYWNDPQSTRNAISEDGWLHTGDIGTLDADGYIRITDRKKDIIVNSGGDNVSPQRIEGFLTLQPEIAQAMVYGDRRPHLVALVVPAEDWARTWAAERERPGDLAALCRDGDFRRTIADAIERVNRTLSNIEKIRRFALTPEPFSVDNGMMTPTLKIRRHKIREVFGEMLAGLYDDRK